MSSRHSGARSRASRSTVAAIKDDVRLAVSADLSAGRWATRVGRTPAGKQLFKLAEVADRPPLLILALSTLATASRQNDERLERSGWRMLACLAVATIAARAGKKLISRSRPDRLVDRGEHRIGVISPGGHDWDSFPSGHTAAAVAMAQAVARDYPERQAPALIAALLAGVMKIFRGHHFPSDVAAGAMLGLVVERVVSIALPAKAAGNSAANSKPESVAAKH